MTSPIQRRQAENDGFDFSGDYAPRDDRHSLARDPMVALARFAAERDRHDGGYPGSLTAASAHQYDDAAPHDGFGEAFGDQDDADYPPEAYAPSADADDDTVAAGHDGGGGGRGLALIGTVLGVVVLGTGGVLAYRAMSTTAVFSGTPPIIEAASEPTKITPERPAATETASQRTIFNPPGEKVAESNVVGGAEEPLERPPAVRREVSRVILPPPGQSVDEVPATADAGHTAVPGGATDMRRVRTIAIRPQERDDSPFLPPQQPFGASGTILPPIGSEPSIADFATAPVHNVTTTASPPAPQPLEAEPAALPAPVETAAAPAAAVPLPLARPPGVAARAAEPVRTAALPAAASQSHAPAGTNVYRVQLTSQKSAAEARNAFMGLQRKYPQILGSYQPNLQQVSLGERGTFFRVRVGEFSTRDAATSFCVNFKAAGGDCLVQSN